MINYNGSVNLAGSVSDSLGESATFSGRLGITLSANYNGSGSGTATETVSGSINVAYSYGSYSGSESLPVNFTTPAFAIQTGSFQINQQTPVEILGLEFGVSLTGSVSLNEQSISEALTATVSGSYQGVNVYGQASGSGTLQYIPASPVITGTATQFITGTSSTFPFRNVAITDPNPAAQTETVTVTSPGTSAGTLSNFGSGSFNTATGVYTVSGTPAQVSAALEALQFTPNNAQGPAGSTVTDTFTIHATNSLGLSATDSATRLTETIPGLAILANFTGANGSSPFGLITDAAGDLFGVTALGGQYGDGEVFETAKTGTGYASTPIPLASFNFFNGYLPNGNLVADSAGNLFGTTLSGGAHDNGTVFEIATTGTGYASTPTVLLSFNVSNGSQPDSGLLVDASGDLFGTTQSGGAHGDGTVYEIVKNAGTYATAPVTLISFAGSNGSTPDAPLIADAAGDLFGTTYSGGSSGDGTVFEIVKTAGTYASTPTILANFNFTNGANPTTGLAIDSAGNLFGTTRGGGSATSGFVTYSGEGTIFEIAKTSGGYASTITTLADFNVTDGGMPEANVIIDATGDLFGTTVAGGTNQQGTVFELAKTGGVYASTPTTLTLFNGTNGSDPEAGLIADSSGDLIGTTAGGGLTGAGTVFELNNAVRSTGYVVDPVSIAGTTARQVTSDRASLSPLRNVVIADVETGQTETVTVTVSATANGTLSGLGGGTYTNGVYTDTGTAAQITAALDGLVFTPTQNQVAAGQSVATTFTIQDTDTAGFTATDSTTTVIAAPPVTIATNGATSLVQIANQYALYNNGTAGPWLMYQGAVVTAGQFASTITPVGATRTASGYAVAWNLGANEYLIWNTDSNGNYTSTATGNLPGSGYTLQDLELAFGQNLNGDGTTGPVTTPVGTNGALVQLANQYALKNTSGAIVAWLSYQGSPVTAGEFGSAVTPVGAKQTANGYEVAWSVASANEYLIWNTDSNGNYTGSATALLGNTSTTLEAVEANFGEVFSGAGPIAATTTIVSNGTTALV